MVPGVPLHPANRGGICGGTFGDIGLLGASMDKLTATAIRNAKPADKPVRLFDGRGLYLEVTPKGRPYWRLKYQIGRASCRERVCQYVSILVGAVSLKKKNK